MIETERRSDGIAVVTFDTPGEKVNLLSEAALTRLAEVVGMLEREAGSGSLRGVVFASAKEGCFIAGADVKAFVPVGLAGDAAAAASKAREGQALFSRIAALPVPTVAAINGACLGGGLELALACTARVAGDGPEVSLALPEVRLGLIPGWGGTQRLPRLLGATRALDLILTGRTLSGRQAHRIGLVTRVAPREGLSDAASQEALRLAGGGTPARPPRNAMDRSALTRGMVFAMARRRAIRQTSGRYPAPLAAIDAVRFGMGRPLDEGLAREADLVGRLLVGEVSRNLVQIFLASRRPSAGPREAAAPAAVERIGVVGAGTMGGGIAALAAMGGLPVRLRDVSADALARGMGQLGRRAAQAVRKGRLPRHEMLRRRNLVAPAVDWTGFSRCDLVIEAVVEDLEVKRDVLRRVEAASGPGTVFATNTSSLSVAAIAVAASRPARVIGLHFFNPVEKMPLVEVVRAPASCDEAVEAGVRLARRLGKTPVVVSDTPGFVVNRILMPYLAGAMRLLIASGKAGDIVTIDRAMTGFGMPMGPFALLDRIGIDVAERVAQVLGSAFPDRADDGARRLLQAMTQSGRLGAKAGEGFYRYAGGDARPRGTGRGLAGLLGAVGAAGTAPLPPAGEIADRLVDMMVNEAAMLLDEGAVDGPAVIDTAMVFGAGFPPFRGGLLRHADTVGAAAIGSRLAGRGLAPARRLTQKGRFHP